MLYHTIQNNPVERATVTYPYVWWDNLFTDEEMAKMLQYFESQGTEEGQVVHPAGFNKGNTASRVSDIKFHTVNADTKWIFDRFNVGISQINTQFYNYDLNGYDAIQYGEYHADKKGRYNWHMDTILGAEIDPGVQTRKLSITFLLNEPGVDFEGGQFELNTNNESNPIPIDAKKGRVIAFPSYILHRVKPVTRGVRKSLVIWVLGPKFK